jgi:MSHA biogenesis protein MshJ
MGLHYYFIKYYYQLKLKIDSLSERDRVLALLISIFFLVLVWCFLVFRPQLSIRNQTNQEILALQMQSSALEQKRQGIEDLVNTPDIVRLINRHNELTVTLKKLDEQFKRYNERYINKKDLVKLLHDILKQTLGVSIDSFSTVESEVAPVPATTADATTSPLVAEAIHYRLIMRGGYFAVMNYLKRLETLPWQLYWDKFDYTVTKYPEGLATVDFYTLKVQGSQQMAKQ